MKREWLLKRNCSLSPRQVAFAFALLCVGAVGNALYFLLHGFWIVFAFAGVELAGVAVALLHYARHATDHEHIALSEDCLLVERVEAGELEQIRLDPCWVRIAPPSRTARMIGLESRGVKVEIGGFVSEQTRHTVAEELRRALRGSSCLA